MYKNNRILALIPARGGSKGLPGKNLRLLGGKPLIVWSVEAGLRSKHIDSVMVTTDSEEIARVSKKPGRPFLSCDRLGWRVTIPRRLRRSPMLLNIASDILGKYTITLSCWNPPRH